MSAKGRSGRRRATTSRNQPRYPRTARLNELLREILAEELERVDDDRLTMVTVTSVDTEADIRRAVVFFDSLQGPEGDEEVLSALSEHRVRLQAAVNRQSRLKRTPELSFRPDDVVRRAAQLDHVLRELAPSEVPEVVVPDEIERLAERDRLAGGTAADDRPVDGAAG
ncbi:MAG: 30S ribosome-binding factor RbfA [Acidimicrobiales bacterium]